MSARRFGYEETRLRGMAMHFCRTSGANSENREWGGWDAGHVLDAVGLCND